MQIQSISAVTNPFNIMARERRQDTKLPQINAQQKNEPKSDVFTKTEDGRYISKSIDPESGEVLINITKINWSNEGVLDSVEETVVPMSNKNVGVQTVTDYEHNTVSKGLVTDPLRESVNQTLVTEKKDPITGKTIAKETYTMSDVPGIYNVTETDALGRTKVITSAHKTKDGAIYISKNMTSLDGTTTTYRYTKDASGNHIRMYNQIADKNGNVLSTVDRTYDRVNENLAYSSINGRKYTIEQKGKDTVVTDQFAGEKTVLNEDTFKVPESQEIMFEVLDAMEGYTPPKTRKPVVKQLLHDLPGDVLIDMSKNVNYIIPVKDNLDSAFMGIFGTLNCNTNGFVISHELGHSKDDNILSKNDLEDMAQKSLETVGQNKELSLEEQIVLGTVNTLNESLEELPEEFMTNPIADNPEFQKEYFNEKAMFLKAFPSFKEDYIDYFLFATDGQTDRGRKETVAETNAMNSHDPVPMEILAMRTQVLQQYFPRTIAVATKLTTPIAVENNEHKEIIVPEKKIITPQIEIV